jgi:hypothetical protein
MIRTPASGPCTSCLAMGAAPYRGARAPNDAASGPSPVTDESGWRVALMYL